MYRQGLDMPLDDIVGTLPGHSSECRTGSSGSKRKREGQIVETVKIIRNTMEYVNDQLKTIAEWLNLQHQDASATRGEVIKQLQRILELSRYDRAYAICGY